MKDHIDILENDGNSLVIRLKDPSEFDPHILELAGQDSNCLPIVHQNGRLSYDTRGLVSLEWFLEQYIFEGREGYAFLIDLFEKAIRSNRAKPVLFEPDCVYLSPYGDGFRFVILPLKTELWLLQKEKTRQWTEAVRKQFRTVSCYEIPGFLQAFEHSREFSMPALVQGLRDLHAQYYPRKFRFLPEKPLDTFRAREAVSTYRPRPEKEPVLMEKTQVLAAPQPAHAFLEGEGDRWDLPFESMKVGRGMQCDIRLPFPDVSTIHAQIIREEDRYYIKAEKAATNGTWLNDKKVQRRMRLKNGMQVKFGSRAFTFVQ